MMSPSDYWNRVAETKTFHHPFDVDRVPTMLPRDARILDVGCGYGRTLAQLAVLGYHRLVGVDPAGAMIARGRHLYPDLDLRVLAPGPLAFPDACFDAVLLIAVLTCVPADDDQRALVAEIRRVLRPGGLLYVSDFLLAADERNVARYREGTRRFPRYGIFEHPEGVVLRHHDPVWIRELTSGFDEISLAEFEATTMNGNPARGFQFVGGLGMPPDCKRRRKRRSSR